MKMMNESVLSDKFERGAENYFNKYRDQMESLQSKSPLSKMRTITAFDIYQLGSMLESCDEFFAMCEADGSNGDLGIIPRIAYDVVSLSYGTSPMSIVATTQTIQEEQGVVYYKNVVAQSNLGNMTAGQSIYSATAAPKFPIGYSDQVVSESCGNTTSSAGPYSGTLTYVPLRPYTLSIVVADTVAITLTDDGNGNLVGVGGYGTILYSGTSQGAYSFTLLGAPTSGKTITASYMCQIEAKTDVPIAQYELVSKPIMARVYALKSTFGMLKSFQLRKRFGVVAEDEATIDLTNAINIEIFGDMLRKMLAATVGNTTWASTPPTGVSLFEHYQTFKYSLNAAENVMVTNAGRGTKSFMIAGSTACGIIQSLPGFTMMFDGNSISGAHMFGTLDGVPVIRVPVAALMPANKVIIGYKGVSAFEAAAVYAPYMPLTVTSVLPTPNPILQQKAAAVWAAVDVLVPNFLTLLTIS